MSSEDFSTRMEIIDILNKNVNLFDISMHSSPVSYFPQYLADRLDRWLDRYKNIYPTIQSHALSLNINDKLSPDSIVQFSDGLKISLNLYYEGKVFEATQKFNLLLNGYKFAEKGSLITIPKNSLTFYRARKPFKGEANQSTMFHVPFELRHLVSTARYSIPGLPSLYLGDSAYVCWEELNRPDLKKLLFSKLISTSNLSILNIERFEDFTNEVQASKNRITGLENYIATYPLILACTTRPKYVASSFKAEYVIPQLLLQYVSAIPFISGIRFPSSKVNYQQVKFVKSYNYVFPVKSIAEEGFCKTLKAQFFCSQPISHNLNEILNFGGFSGIIDRVITSDSNRPTLSILNGRKTPYDETSFGAIESILENYPPTEVIL